MKHSYFFRRNQFFDNIELQNNKLRMLKHIGDDKVVLVEMVFVVVEGVFFFFEGFGDHFVVRSS